jgi:RimJ/RimL family protein N-acetyltransferase
VISNIAMSARYSARLTLRPVSSADLPWITSIGADARVMGMLGGTRTPAQVRAWLERELAQFERYGYCRNLVSYQDQPVGLVGLSRSDFDRGLVPGIEIAWQLAYAHWGQGFATEAARCVLNDAFASHGISELVAITSVDNARSRSVMERLEMRHCPSETFEHPELPAGHPLRTHVVYRVALARETALK